MSSPRDTNTPQEEPVDYTCVPGTTVEVVVERNGVAGTAQRLVVGRTTVECTAR